MRPGDLVSAVNVVQGDKAGVYKKRNGWTKSAMTFSGGTTAGRPESVLSTSTTGMYGNGKLMSDATDQLWAHDPSGSTWTYKGDGKRVYATSSITDTNPYSQPKPVVCLVGSNLWSFGLETNQYRRTVHAASTMQQVLAPTTQAATGIVHANAAYDGTYVWFLYVTNAAIIYCHRYTAASPGTSPTITTFHTVPDNTGVAARLQQVDVMYFVGSSGTPLIFVAYCGHNSTSRLYVGHAWLNIATGLATSPTTAADTIAGPTLNVMNGLCISANQSTVAYSRDKIYYSYYGWAPGGLVTSADIRLVMVTLSTLAVASIAGGGCDLNVADTVVSSISLATNAGGADKQIVLVTRHAAYVGGSALTCYWAGATFDGGVLATQLVPSGVFQPCDYWLASRFGVTEDLTAIAYYMVGYDDVDIGRRTIASGSRVANSAQRTYFVRAFSIASGAVTNTHYYCGQVLRAGAAALFHNYSSSTFVSLPFGTQCPALVTYNSNNLLTVVGANEASAGGAGLSRVKVEPDADFGQEVLSREKAIRPGGIPLVWGANDAPHELSPLVYPPYIYESAAGVGAVFAGIAAVYVIRDADGTVWRSAPMVAVASIGTGAGWAIPALYVTGPTTTVQIEVYLGTTATLKLQTILSNTPTPGSTHVYYTTPATAGALVPGEALYTLGGGLSQMWPMQCQTVATWNNRIFLMDQEAIYYSSQLEEGIGAIFNEVLCTTWSEPGNAITGGCAIDGQSFAVFGTRNVGIIVGDGPNNLGEGAYAITTLPCRKGTSLTSPKVAGPAGAYAQERYTNRLFCVQRDGSVTDCAPGFDNANPFTAAIWNERLRLLIFSMFGTSGMAVLDYRHTDPATPFGLVSTWSRDAGGSWALYCLGGCTTLWAGKSVTMYSIDDYGDLYYYDPVAYTDGSRSGTSVYYKASLTTGPLQLLDLQGEFEVSKVQVLGTFNQACTVAITTYPDYSASGTTVTKAVTASPLQLMTRPPNAGRVQAIQIKVAETSDDGAAFDFEGIALEFFSYGGVKQLNTSQVI